jgi:putative tricarboxylic transport membrane protein
MATPPDPAEKPSRPGPSTRGPELGVAAVLMVLAVMVIADSLRVGIGWADDGPRSGYFPFYIGLFLLLASGSIVISTLLKWRTLTAVFAERQQLATVFAVLIPMVVYVGGIWLLGIYLASALLIGYFMRRYGKFGWPTTGAVSVGVPLAFFLVFERWFLVPLPKGPIERLLGF